MTKEQIIRLAVQYAGRTPNGTQGPGDVSIWLDMYEVHKNDLLERTPKSFAFKIARDLPIVEGGEDLKFKYKYKLPRGVVEVHQLNPSTLSATDVGLRSTYPLLSIGLVGNEEDILNPQETEGSFTVRNGVLHTNVEVTDIIYSFEDSEIDFPALFVQALAYHLAAGISRSHNADPHKINQLQKQANDMLATVEIKDRTPRDLDSQAIRAWIDRYFKYSSGVFI